MRFLRYLVLLVFPLVSLQAADDFIWIEGEAASSTNMTPHPWYAGQVDKTQLSGGAFLSNFGPDEGRAEYQFNAPKEGSYTFWIRANPIGNPQLEYQLNGGDWKPVDFTAKTDVINIASDNKPDLRFIAWIKVGEVPLKFGPNTLALKFTSENQHHGSVDCLVFTQTPFAPSGKLKPGEKLGTKDEGWWAFEPGTEAFAKDALLDLRPLNEAEAGQSGFIRAEGDFFRLGNGQPVRFWAVNTGVPPGDASKEQLDFMAARFAKLGINMVRIHGPLFDRQGNDPTKIDPARLDKYFYLVNALKKQGIYVHLSTYFPLWMNLKASDGIPGTEDVIGKVPFGLLIFEPRMQEIYRAWLKQILTTKSPYSGKTLAEETSVGVFEIQNEDSLFFWTFGPGNLGKGPRTLLEKKFGTWLKAKYGSLDRLPTPWYGDKHPDDLFAEGQVGLYGASEMSSEGFPRQSSERQRRLLDQIQFLAQLQRDFYADTHKYLRDELGAKWPISASNWITVPGLGFLERYTYSGVEVIDKHGYFGGRHEGEGSGWSVRNGHTYTDVSALREPNSVPFQLMRLPGHPHIQTEIAWNKPNRFVGEGEGLISAYASLQGLDGVYLFSAGSGSWENSGGGKWPYMMPGEIGQSPAEALQYRRGDLQPGETILRQVTSVEDILKLKSANLREGANADFRIVEAPKSSQPDSLASFDPLSFFVGRVERTLEPNAVPIVVDLGKFIDRGRKRITSSTGQIAWDYGNGLVTVNAPRSQAAIGFLAQAGAIRLGDCVIESKNEYGTIHLISLDGEPLATSRNILVQAFTEEKMEGFSAENGEIKDIGHLPTLVKEIEAKVTIGNGSAMKAQVLNEQGYFREALPVEVRDGNAVIALPKNAMYTILSR